MLKNLLLIFFLNVWVSTAQTNTINFTMNHLRYAHSIVSNDTSEHMSSKSLQLLPSIGYARLLKKKVWFGVELGYRNSKYKDINEYNYANQQYKQTVVNSLPLREYFICPSVSKVWYWEHLKMQSSIILPVEYVTKREQLTIQSFISKTTNDVVAEFESLTVWPKYFVFGIYLNCGLYFKILKRTYVGVQLGIGIINETRFGSIYKYITEKEYGVVTSSSANRITYKANFVGGIDIRPTISLNYEF